mgnify:CR=1 FL=1
MRRAHQHHAGRIDQQHRLGANLLGDQLQHHEPLLGHGHIEPGGLPHHGRVQRRDAHLADLADAVASRGESRGVEARYGGVS